MSIFELIWPFFFPIVAAVIAGIHIRMKKHHGSQALGVFLMWQIAIGLGLGYVYAGMGHLFVADKVAESIGWPAGSPFQREVGMWDAAMGIVALLCLKFRDTGFWTATILGIGIFSVSAGLGHVYEMVVHGDLFARTMPGRSCTWISSTPSSLSCCSGCCTGSRVRKRVVGKLKKVLWRNHKRI